ncbi:MAG: LysM peptidoglycan-binding domain-containing protein [Anaerolineae bacterium]|nr:LysM peptidoglycan-binding domain-containing protein [Anaerolineae bacterium]
MGKRSFYILLAGLGLVAAILACTRPGSEKVVYVTATFPGGVLLPTETSSAPTDTPIKPTPNPARFDTPVAVAASGGGGEQSYTVQSGDTLNVIAARFGTTAQAIMSLNGLTNPDILEVGQVLRIPANTSAPPPPSSNFKTIPDSELVYSPAVKDFDVAAYVKLKPGFLRVYSEEISGELWSGVELVNQVALDYSVNPRLLLALIEYQSGWLSDPNPPEDRQNYPMGIVSLDRVGLWRQLLAAANALNAGYYSWKYRGLETSNFADGTLVTFAPELNAGTVAVQFFFSQFSTPAQYQIDISEQGFFQTYLALFGDPFRTAVEPLVPDNLQQPTLMFPFGQGETWYFTGGPHGGYNSGSAWASVDFAPPTPSDELVAQQGYCYISVNWVTAVAPGVVARSGEGYVILDLDGDGNEHTGWTVVYLHISSQEVVKPGTRVETGDKLGHPSCEGGYSTGTHLHFGRRYNGEWIPVTCDKCPKGVSVPPLVLSGWTVLGYPNAEYQGYMINDKLGAERRANVGREDPINQISW